MLRTVLLSLMIGCMVALAVIYQVSILWFITGCLGVILLHMILVASLTKRAFAMHVHLAQTSYRAGEQAHIHLQVANLSRLPLFWVVVEHTWCNETNGQNYTIRQLLIPLLRQSFTVEYRLQHLQRGRYDSTGASVTIGDVFGLTHKTVQIRSAAQFIVYPRTSAMMPRFTALLHEQSIANDQHQQTASFQSIRDYTTDDPLNRIHWKSSARSNELKTKVSEAGEGRDLVLLLDNASQHEGVFEQCVQVTASVAEYALTIGRKVYLSSSNDQRVLLDVSSLQSLEQALMMLATVRAGCDTDLHVVLQAKRWQQMRGAMMICVTANLSEPLMAAIATLRAENLSMMVLFIHTHVKLSWHHTQLKQQLQALGCTFQAIPHVQLADEVIADVS